MNVNVLRMVLGISSDAVWVMDILLLLLYEDVLLYELVKFAPTKESVCSLYKHFLKHGSLGLSYRYLFTKRKQSHVIMNSWTLAQCRTKGTAEGADFRLPSESVAQPHHGPSPYVHCGLQSCQSLCFERKPQIWIFIWNLPAFWVASKV